MDQVESVVESAYRLHLNPDSGTIFSESSAIFSVTTSDPVQGLSRKFIKSFSSPFSVPSGQLLLFSESRKYRLHLSTEASSWEIWDKSRILKVIPYKAIHSKPILHSTIGRPSWSFDDQFVVYSAEALGTLKNNLWGRDEKVTFYRDNYGDELTDVYDLKLFVMNVRTGNIQMIDTQGLVAMHPTFHPLNLTFAYTAYPKDPFLVGYRTVTNRVSFCVVHDLIANSNRTLKKDDSVKGVIFPKFSPDGLRLSVLANPLNTFGHTVCLKMLVYNLSTGLSSVLIDVIQENRDVFNGIYGYQDKFQFYNWLSNETIAFQSSFRASWSVFLVHSSGSVNELEFPLAKPYGSTILDIHAGNMLLKCSNYKTSEQVFIYSDASGTLTLLDDLKVEAQNDIERNIQMALDSATFSFISLNGIESVLTSRPENSLLLVSMHGGPHGLTQPEYGPNSSVRLCLGFNILEVNFSGTSGFGDTFRHQLNGHAGQIEVKECAEVIETVRKMLNPKKLLLHGKSFGGFLSAHLATIVKPDAAVILNAVGNIALMHSTSDMDNWGYNVALSKETEYPPSSEDYMKMYSISPISKMHLINCPIFLAAGGADPRVTPLSTLEMYRTLKHLNKDVEFYLFPNDGHGFEQTKTGFELLARTYIWALDKFKVS